MSTATVRNADRLVKRRYAGEMDNQRIDSRYYRLARALFGAYNVHSGGLAYNKQPVPSWSAIMACEHDNAKTPEGESTAPQRDGVIGHWAYVAQMTASGGPDHAEAMARDIEDKHEDNEIFRRLIS